MKTRCAAVAILMLVAAALPAQQLPVRPRTFVAQINPLGLLQFGPNIELVVAPAPHLALSGGLRIPTLGLAAHLLAAAEGDGLRFAWTVGGSLLLYPGPRRLEGLFIGPHFETGKADTELGETTLRVYAGEFGWRWMRPSGFTITAGGMMGVIHDDFIGDDPADSNKEKTFLAMGVLTIGKAF